MPTQCILAWEGQRTKAFRNKANLERNFLLKHLQYHPAEKADPMPHPTCQKVCLVNADHLQNHATMVHSTATQ